MPSRISPRKISGIIGEFDTRPEKSQDLRRIILGEVKNRGRTVTYSVE